MTGDITPPGHAAGAVPGQSSGSPAHAHRGSPAHAHRGTVVAAKHRSQTGACCLGFKKL